jgi:hypothetical protein
MINALGKDNQPVSFKKVVGKLFNNNASQAVSGHESNVMKAASAGTGSEKVTDHGKGGTAKRTKVGNAAAGPQSSKKILNGDELLTADLGSALFAVIGGENSKFAAMKDKLQMKVLKRKKPVARKYSIFFEEDSVSERDIHAALDNDHVVALRCSRPLALSMWPPFAEKCRIKIGKQKTNDPSLTASLKSPHVAEGSLVAMRDAVCWCIGGFLDQRECQRAGQVIVGEAKTRSEQGGPGRNFFVSRPRAVFDDDEKLQRLDHLFPSVKDRTKLKIDEEAAYSVSNETSAAKVAQIARKILGAQSSTTSGAAVDVVIDATACVGGNALAFARCFRKVLAIEIDASKVAFLKENIAHVRSEEQHDTFVQSKLTDDFQVVHGDCLDELPRALDAITAEERVLVFADPPWGGRHYASSTSGGGGGTSSATSTAGVHLKGCGSLAALVDLCAKRRCVGALLLKLPSHFDVESFVKEQSVVHHHDVHLLSNQVTLLVLHYNRQTSPLEQAPSVQYLGQESPAPVKNKKQRR